MLTQPDRFDVALLHLDRPVFYQDNIIPICLPPPDIHLTGKVGLVAGWGKTDNSFGKTGTNILHKVLVPIIKNDECIRWHEDKNILVQVWHTMNTMNNGRFIENYKISCFLLFWMDIRISRNIRNQILRCIVHGEDNFEATLMVNNTTINVMHTSLHILPLGWPFDPRPCPNVVDDWYWFPL